MARMARTAPRTERSPADNERRIAVIGGRPAALAKARAAGLSVIWITLPGSADPEGLAVADETHQVDFQDLDVVLPLLRRLHEDRPLHRVVSMTELGLLPAAHAVTELGLPGNGVEVVRLLSDKLAMRQRLSSLGISPVRAREGRSPADLRAFVAEVGPTVVKPRAGLGSLGVRSLESVDEIPALWAWLREFGLVPFLMEEYLRGAEVSVETLTFGGAHTVVAVTAKETGPGFVEVGHVVPAPLTVEQDARVRALVCRVLDAVRLGEGPAHTEVVLTRAGPRVVESHNRRGGDRITDLVRAVYGVDIDAVAFGWYAGTWYAGTQPRVEVGRPDGAAAVRFLSAEPGVVSAVSGVAAARAHPAALTVEVSVTPGDRVHSVLWSDDRPGLVIARGANAVEAVANARAMAAAVDITTIRQLEQWRPIGSVLSHVDVVLGSVTGEPAQPQAG